MNGTWLLSPPRVQPPPPPRPAPPPPQLDWPKMLIFWLAYSSAAGLLALADWAWVHVPAWEAAWQAQQATISGTRGGVGVLAGIFVLLIVKRIS